jgi:hypothetical protein
VGSSPVLYITKQGALDSQPQVINFTSSFCCHEEVFLYSISKIAFPLFGNRVHITGTKINRHILNTKEVVQAKSYFFSG